MIRPLSIFAESAGTDEPERQKVWLDFYCKDNGIGMSQEFLEKIFDPFDAAHEWQGLRRAYPQAPLPEAWHKAYGPRTAPRSARSPPEGGRADGNRDYSSRHILLVEDNELNQEIALELLSVTGAQVEVACDGAEVAIYSS